MKNNTLLKWIGYGSLFVLLALELVLRYDTWVRQIALATTDIFAILALFITGRYMHRRGYAIPWPVIWFAAAGVWFDGMGNFLHFYANIDWWDKLAHAVGSGAFAAGVFVLIAMFQQNGTIRMGPKLRVLVVVSITTLFTALYEISEYLGDKLFATFRITGLYDTADDLLWDVLAAVVVALVAHRLTSRSARGGT